MVQTLLAKNGNRRFWRGGSSLVQNFRYNGQPHQRFFVSEN